MNGSVFGADPGSPKAAAGSNLSNTYPTIPDQSVEAIADRVQPRQMPSGVMRGTQRIVNTDGSYITMGEIPDNSGQFGIAYWDANGNLIQKDNGVTTYKYDANGRNYYQNGLLPNGTYNEAIAKSPYSVADAITAG